MSGEYLLIVEDDERIGSTLLRALSSSGYDATWVRCGVDALDAVSDRKPDLVLLDVGLPDIDGLDVCRRIHGIDPLVDVIMVTARDEELDIVVGLDAGAVDYVTKPFRLAELTARIRAQLRRTEARPVPGSVGDLTLDTESRRVFLRGLEIELRAKEFDLLARLIADAGTAVTRETLMSDVWDEQWFGSTKTLDFHIASLRRKIDDPDEPSRVTTLRGVGYRFEV
ncbi:MAG: response regulator transcription factor [Acidimicrobiales bacterium]